MITDHAVHRYMQRMHGLKPSEYSMKKERQKLKKLLRTAIKQGACGLKIHGGKFVIVDGDVVTFLRNDDRRLKDKRNNCSDKYYKAKKLGIYE
ncbi:hypothetical protein GWO43_30210 [candidate division KSB1 bacterium]|nr:hypothetical protein [candidate division KSB1 bacterium]NIV70632.1 hypothetical protein [Phycisphaerae bacterium]NIS28165.1 hypothetical protein [candidate division KSB1 bacterium]NIT75057.1 hypothetical protein [candidate division KSB1 bacterium]NIU28843.1 hypothetical protein [candidate division KSB1 bacterium]